jgi:hypothetical protein
VPALAAAFVNAALAACAAVVMEGATVLINLIVALNIIPPAGTTICKRKPPVAPTVTGIHHLRCCLSFAAIGEVRPVVTNATEDVTTIFARMAKTVLYLCS